MVIFPLWASIYGGKCRLVDGKGSGSKLGHIAIVPVQGQPELWREILSGGWGKGKMPPPALDSTRTALEGICKMWRKNGYSQSAFTLKDCTNLYYIFINTLQYGKSLFPMRLNWILNFINIQTFKLRKPSGSILSCLVPDNCFSVGGGVGGRQVSLCSSDWPEFAMNTRWASNL